MSEKSDVALPRSLCVRCSRGLMDKAPPSKGGDCGFESRLEYLRQTRSGPPKRSSLLPSPPAASARFFGATSCCHHPRVAHVAKKFSTLPDLCVSSLRRGHANILCVVPILTNDPRRESVRIPSGRLVRPAAAETRYKERDSKPTGLDGCVRVFPRLMSLVNNGNKKRILKPAARAGGRTVPSHNLSCTACHSYLGTQLQVKACHHTPKKLWNQIHVHRTSHCSLNFANAVRATQIGRAVSQPSGGKERWRRLVKSGGLQSRV